MPKDFWFDGMSTPWFLWVFGGKFRVATLRAALLHDYLYSIGVDRKIADKVFLNIMKEDGVNFPQFYYYGVRAFGWLYHKKGK